MPALRSLLVFVAAVAPWATVLPDSASARFTVSARVAPRAAILPLASPTGLSVSDADLVRGQVEIELAYQAISNDPRGLVVEVAPRLGLADEIVVELSDARAVLGDTQLEFTLRDCARCELRIRYRLRLREGLAAGEYPLPWQVSARPI
jgi:hypothetical protein